MTQFIPISLSGNSLGERHRLLNSLVEDAFRSKLLFESIKKLPETTPVDRLFKIDLASKHRDVAYIVTNLKDPDMLYVSRALKATWLLEAEHTNIFNPSFLEEQLFPDMTPAAVSKVQYWLLRNLRDPERCRDFYLHYKDIKFKTAIKFLWHCSIEYILEESETIIGKIKPHYLKVLSEKCPQLTKCFYRRLEHDRDVLSNYLGSEKKYFNNLKFILKSDPETFFDVTEKYYNKNKFHSFSADISKYVMFNHKDRFINKSELYTAWLLNINVIAQYLSTEEIKDLILKLAKAEYLGNWFTYKKVEPLIKKLNKHERVTFKKYVFVDKAFGEKTKEWPYTPPTSPVLGKKPTYSLFLDDNLIYNRNPRLIECRRRGGYPRIQCLASLASRNNHRLIKRKTLLDQLFDKYRFSSFESTLFELRKRLRAESSLQNREYMLLVLVSKSGGREDSLRALFELLAQYKNEPVHLRAAIVRSLVTRAFAWRLPSDLWKNLLEWGHGLGLDGNLPEADCKEGLHAIVLRNLLADEMPDPNVLKRFLNEFSHFTKYTLSTEERSCVRTRLPNLLLVATQSNTEFKKSRLLDYLLDTLAAYKMNFDEFPGVVYAVSTAFQENPKEASHLLRRLFDARFARKELFKENFAQIQNDASYVNALRHDISVLDVTTFENVKTSKEKYYVLHFEQFFRKLIVYFSEKGGLAERYYALFKFWADTKPNRLLARPLAILAKEDFASLLEIPKDIGPMTQFKSAKRGLAKALRDNIHISRPLVDLRTLGLRNAGIRAAATFASRSPKNQREGLIKELMTWQRTLTLALTLTDSEELDYIIYKTLVNSKPKAALKAFMRYLRKKQFASGFYTIWNIVKSVFTELNYKKLGSLLEELDIMYVPDTIKAEFCILIYRAHLKMDETNKTQRLLQCLGNILYEVDETFIYDVLKDFLEHKLDKYEYVYMYPTININIIGKFLLLCCSEETQKRRLETVGEPFFACLEGLWKEAKCRQDMVQYFENFLLALKYNKVFFDVNYVSCLPVFERVVAWMHSFLPIDKWFVYYTHIQLTMLYYKAARMCVTQQPGYFTANSSDLDKGVEMFGATFGKLVASAYEELNVKYFNSIRVLYKKDLNDFLCKYVHGMKYDESTEKFVIAFVISILEEVEAKEAHFLAYHVFTQHKFKYNFDVTKIANILKETNNNELRISYNLDQECSVKTWVPTVPSRRFRGWQVVEVSSESESESELECFEWF